jgi:Putative Ig domain
MKTSSKLAFSVWLTLATALIPVDSVMARGMRADAPTGTCALFDENFDGVTPPALPAGWVATNVQGPAPLWVTGEISRFGNAAVVDDPATISDKLLDTPPVTITSGPAQLTFQNNYDLEGQFDGGVLEISIAGGAFTDILAAGGSFVTGGYNATISTSFQSPIGGRQAWSGTSGSYITTIADLGPNVAGQTIVLRFRMASDNSQAGAGWSVDTIEIRGVCPPPTPTPPPPMITSPFIASRVVGEPFTYQFEAVGATELNANNLPPGLTFDRGLKAIILTPTEVGTYPVTLIASNDGGTTTGTLTINVQPTPAAGPVIASSTAATGRVGQPFAFQVYTTGGTPAGRVTATGLPPGLTIDPVTGRISGTPTTEGSSAVTLTVTDGGFTATGILELTFSADPARPVIISPDIGLLTLNQFFSYTINAPSTADPDTDPTIFTFLGNLPQGLSFDAENGIISGTYIGPFQKSPEGGPREPDLSGGALLGSIQLFATNSHGTSTFQLLFLAAPSGVINISTRLLVGTSENVLIGGFIITGNTPKVVIIRALGPSTGLPGALQDPTLELHDSANPPHIVFNDNWRDTQQDLIIGTTIPPTDDRESAIVIALDHGAYTAIVAGKNGTTGIGLVEVYDLGTASLDTSGLAKLANIATRGFVDTGDNVMIGGFIIRGGDTRVIVRAIGPSLTQFGITNALADPTLELRDSNAVLLFANDDWRSTQAQEIIDTGVPPTNDLESAIVQTLSPGAYTAIVRGKDNGTGVASVEVYSLQ